MVHVRMPLTLCGACIADFSACLAQGSRVWPAYAHQMGGCSTHEGTFPVEGNAVDHHFDVILVQALRRTIFTLGSAAKASFNAAAVILIGHSGIDLVLT